jgi:hypothetical protein
MHTDHSSRPGAHKDLDKERLWGDDIWWCWPICMQLCLLPFTSVCRAKWDKVSLCACTSVLDHRWGDANAICCFLVGGTCFFVLIISISIHLALNLHKHLSLYSYGWLLLRWMLVLKCSNKRMGVWWMKKSVLIGCSKTSHVLSSTFPKRFGNWLKGSWISVYYVNE